MLDRWAPHSHNNFQQPDPFLPLQRYISNDLLHLRACLLPKLICPCLYSLCVQVCSVMEIDRSTCPLPLLLHPTLGDVPLGTLDIVCILHSVCMCVCGPTHVCVHSLEVHGVACVSPCSSLAFLVQHSHVNLVKSS